MTKLSDAESNWHEDQRERPGRMNDQAKSFDPGFAAFDDLCESLTEQFWAQHYPGGDLSTVGSDYESLRQQAGELMARIQASIVSRTSGEAESNLK